MSGCLIGLFFVITSMAGANTQSSTGHATEVQNQPLVLCGCTGSSGAKADRNREKLEAWGHNSTEITVQQMAFIANSSQTLQRHADCLIAHMAKKLEAYKSGGTGAYWMRYQARLTPGQKVLMLLECYRVQLPPMSPFNWGHIPERLLEVPGEESGALIRDIGPFIAELDGLYQHCINIEGCYLEGHNYQLVSTDMETLYSVDGLAASARHIAWAYGGDYAIVRYPVGNESDELTNVLTLWLGGTLGNQVQPCCYHAVLRALMYAAPQLSHTINAMLLPNLPGRKPYYTADLAAEYSTLGQHDSELAACGTVIGLDDILSVVVHQPDLVNGFEDVAPAIMGSREYITSNMRPQNSCVENLENIITILRGKSWRDLGVVFSRLGWDLRPLRDAWEHSRGSAVSYHQLQTSMTRANDVIAETHRGYLKMRLAADWSELDYVLAYKLLGRQKALDMRESNKNLSMSVESVMVLWEQKSHTWSQTLQALNDLSPVLGKLVATLEKECNPPASTGSKLTDQPPPYHVAVTTTAQMHTPFTTGTYVVSVPSAPPAMTTTYQPGPGINRNTTMNITGPAAVNLPPYQQQPGGYNYGQAAVQVETLQVGLQRDDNTTGNMNHRASQVSSLPSQQQGRYAGFCKEMIRVFTAQCTPQARAKACDILMRNNQTEATRLVTLLRSYILHTVQPGVGLDILHLGSGSSSPGCLPALQSRGFIEFGIKEIFTNLVLVRDRCMTMCDSYLATASPEHQIAMFVMMINAGMNSTGIRSTRFKTTDQEGFEVIRSICKCFDFVRGCGRERYEFQQDADAFADIFAPGV
ncbi:hypothetical protein [Spongorhabdus nitratireducens]